MNDVKHALRAGAVLRGAAVGLLLVSAGLGPAIAQTAPSSAPASSAPASGQPAKAKADPGDKVICRTEEDTGTRLGSTRICHTKREWDQINHDLRDELNTAGREPGRPK